MELIKLDQAAKDLISRELNLGLNPIENKPLTDEQYQFVKEELAKMFFCRNETPNPALLDAWIKVFEEMANLEFTELIKKIRVARFTKRYGVVTTLADILDVENYEQLYNQHYKQLPKNKHILTLICGECNTVITTLDVFLYPHEKITFKNEFICREHGNTYRVITADDITAAFNEAERKPNMEITL